MGQFRELRRNMTGAQSLLGCCQPIRCCPQALDRSASQEGSITSSRGPQPSRPHGLVPIRNQVTQFEEVSGKQVSKASSVSTAALYHSPQSREEKGMTEDEVVGWHHQLNGHEFE